MRSPLLFLCLALAIALPALADPAPAPTYDAALAARLGADERGMKNYVLVILKTGPNQTASKEERSTMFAGHMSNIGRLAEAGTLVLAGPMHDNDQQVEGIFVFNVTTVKEAEALLATDPAVAGGLLAFEAYAWYGTAALQEVIGIHNRIVKPKP